MADNGFVMVNHPGQAGPSGVNNAGNDAHARPVRQIADGGAHNDGAGVPAIVNAPVAAPPAAPVPQAPALPVHRDHADGNAPAGRHANPNEPHNAHGYHSANHPNFHDPRDSVPLSGIVLTQIFRQPDPRVVRRQETSSYPDTSTYKIDWKGKTFDASPLTWCDMLRPYRFDCLGDGAAALHPAWDHGCPDLPFTRVIVRDMVNEKLSNVSVTPYGMALYAKSEMDINNAGTIASLMPRPGLTDQLSAMQLLRSTMALNMTTNCEEAAMIRAYQMMFNCLPAKFFKRTTNLHHWLNFNCDGPGDMEMFWTSAWTQAEITADHVTQQVAWDTADLECNLFVLTLGEYAKSTSGGHQPTVNLVAATTAANPNRYESRLVISGARIPELPDDTVVIPIMRGWEYHRMLVPYIMAFTTTAWWGAARYARCVPDDERHSDGTSARAYGVVESCLWDIPGNYKRICLVIVDALDGNSAPGVTFGITPNFATTRFTGASPDGNHVEMFLAMMGRLPVVAPAPIPAWYNDRFDINDVFQAMREIERNFLTPEATTRVRSFAALMIGTFSLGFSVYTGGDDARPATWVNGVRAYNIDSVANDNRIGGAGGQALGTWTVPWGDMSNHVQGSCYWRTNALGMMHKSRCSSRGAGHIHFPSLGRVLNIAPDHYVTRMSSNWLVLSMSGLVDIGVKDQMFSSLHGITTSPYLLTQYVLGLATLMAGASGWLLAETGTTIPDLNGFSSYNHTSDDMKLLSVYRRLTDNMVGSAYCTKNVFLMSDEFRAIVAGFTGLANNRLTFSRWYTIHVPFHLVRSVIIKFGAMPTIKTVIRGPDTNVRTDEEDVTEPDLMERIEAYHAGSRSGWFDTALMCESLRYELRNKYDDVGWFKIRVPATNGYGTEYGFIGWFPNTRFDRSKRMASYGEAYTAEHNSEGVIETLCVVVPMSRKHNFQCGDFRYIVSPLCHQKRDVPRSWAELNMVLPDPPGDWIKNIMSVAGDLWTVASPNILAGDVWGAAGAAGMYGVGKLTDWLRRRFSGNNEDDVA